MDPYSHKLIKTDFFHAKRDVPTRVAVVLDGHLENRNLQLIQPLSRAFSEKSIIELIATDDPNAKPGATVQPIAYIAFVELQQSGVILVGDELEWNGKVIGTIAGYDDTHMPNHQNVIISVSKGISGKELGLNVEDTITIKGFKK
ncbi:MAG: hypothetical protein HYV29_09220 [Ignavibacteriales bacterium]|nr:hypothetical protein [Ignavibacteriales bacterium]